MYNSEPQVRYNPNSTQIEQNYTAPDSGSWKDSFLKASSIRTDNENLTFVNAILFVTLTLLALFVVLRFLRGVG